MFATPQMTIAACGMQGWRKKMEDAHRLEFKLGTDHRAAFIAVFDGHNGSAAAKYCSVHLLQHICARPEFAERSIPRALEHGFLDVDHALKATEYGDEGGCTAVAVLALEGKIYCANAGDSRAVMAVKDGESIKVVPLSHDHRPTEPAEMERIARAGGTIQNGRVNGVLALTRAMGDFEFKTAGDDDVITARPDVTTFNLDPQVEFVIVACDGVWDVVTNEEACNFVRTQLIETKGDAGLVAELLLDKCLADVPHGLGTDNMTAAIWIPHASFFAE
eukprot:CAMPEP_0174843048 /NCGR_PEP_ID=MMETSP1114-20130205/10279_1 /TAXON_ID=312471 /ORGANISM="Neobodo designis, Strain CCAP 1951/1" /LENGTH=275 /DNA_ID=CAMNT_0016077261 /DNA_START=75 /DNA_END=902 /DNA_ORIENTATION=+